MAETFDLHPDLSRLESVEDWDLCRVLLMDDSHYPWLVLVPRRDGLRDFHDLEGADLQTATAEIVRASKVLESCFRPDKMNVAALGNQTPQLHIHVIARFQTDPAWPGPIWGKIPARPYDPAEREDLLVRLRGAIVEVENAEA
ncbi:HIT domain-containing protein [Algihabitans sp.]|uniref:HIT domain-containing protein n=1 Tax=Algihabitans sp. TaxID=2821514 RepID=UPI003BAA3CF5